MSKFRIQHSKDAMCDFMLAKLWQGYLQHFYGDQIASDYDTIENSPEIVNNFMIYLENLSNTNDQELAQFGIKDPADLAKILKQAYHNLQNSDINF